MRRRLTMLKEVRRSKASIVKVNMLNVKGKVEVEVEVEVARFELLSSIAWLWLLLKIL